MVHTLENELPRPSRRAINNKLSAFWGIVFKKTGLEVGWEIRVEMVDVRRLLPTTISRTDRNTVREIAALQREYGYH
jgi:hypothetical protein